MFIFYLVWTDFPFLKKNDLLEMCLFLQWWWRWDAVSKKISVIYWSVIGFFNKSLLNPHKSKTANFLYILIKKFQYRTNGDFMCPIVLNISAAVQTSILSKTAILKVSLILIYYLEICCKRRISFLWLTIQFSIV